MQLASEVPFLVAYESSILYVMQVLGNVSIHSQLDTTLARVLPEPDEDVASIPDAQPREIATEEDVASIPDAQPRDIAPDTDEQPAEHADIATQDQPVEIATTAAPDSDVQPVEIADAASDSDVELLEIAAPPPPPKNPPTTQPALNDVVSTLNNFAASVSKAYCTDPHLCMLLHDMSIVSNAAVYLAKQPAQFQEAHNQQLGEICCQLRAGERGGQAGSQRTPYWLYRMCYEQLHLLDPRYCTLSKHSVSVRKWLSQLSCADSVS